MKLALTSLDGGTIRFYVDEFVILLPIKSQHPGANAVLCTMMGNFAVKETPEAIWKQVK